MRAEAECFPFSDKDKSLGRLPCLPLTLSYNGRSVAVSGILDTGASVNVLPCEIGIELGAIWENQTTSVKLTGNLARSEARIIVLTAVVSRFDPVRLAFAWTRAENVPLIMGQVNFFLEFDVCFFASQAVFEIAPKDHL